MTPLVRHVSFLRAAAGAAAVASLLAGCGSNRPHASARTQVTVREKDFRILVAPARIAAGRVQLVVRNAGPADHELIVVRAHRADLPLRTDGLTVNEDALEPATVATLEPAGPGAVRRVNVTLAPGSYELFCNMAGHFMGGMRAFLVVT